MGDKNVTIRFKGTVRRMRRCRIEDLYSIVDF